METIGQRIKQKRLDNQISLKELSIKAGIPLSTLREWESGRQIKGEPYEKIARALDVSLIELLTGQKPKHRELLIKVHEIETACKSIKNYLGSYES